MGAGYGKRFNNVQNDAITTQKDKVQRKAHAGWRDLLERKNPERCSAARANTPEPSIRTIVGTAHSQNTGRNETFLALVVNTLSIRPRRRTLLWRVLRHHVLPMLQRCRSRKLMDLRFRTLVHSRRQLLRFSTILRLERKADCDSYHKIGYLGTSCGIARYPHKSHRTR